jgi:hypothetical protein
MVLRDCVDVALASILFCTGGPGSSVGIATGYGLDGPGIELAASVV